MEEREAVDANAMGLTPMWESGSMRTEHRQLEKAFQPTAGEGTAKEDDASWKWENMRCCTTRCGNIFEM